MAKKTKSVNSFKRQIEDPRYKDQYEAWKKSVFKRDKYKCQMPTCSKKNRAIQAHHIRTWAAAPSLRFEISNGITLCYDCHKSIWGKEVSYAPIFVSIIIRNKNKNGKKS